MKALYERFVAEITVDALRSPEARNEVQVPLPQEELRQALMGHVVVVLRGVRLSPIGLEALARCIGMLEPVPPPSAYPSHPDSGYVKIVSTNADASSHPGASLWHTDQSFQPNPGYYTVLQPQVLPQHGGDTLFADMVSAHEQLPPRWKSKLEGAMGTHAHPLSGDIARHPVIMKLAETGQPTLYLNHLCLTAIHSPQGTEVDVPVDDLIAHATRDELVYRHHWLPGDIVIWDNRRVMHRATPFSAMAPRVMHRITVAHKV